jgi:putative membrane protein
MGEFQKLWGYYAEEKKTKGARKTRKSSKEKEPATVKAASAISEAVFAHKLTKAEKEIAGPAVHYAMGAASGAIYGGVAELVPDVTAGAGMPFGAAVWLVADDITLPAVGLAKWPTEYPVSTHAYALASHLVYGLTTEAVRRAVRSIF